MIYVANNGPVLVATNYWDDPVAQAGLFVVSLNAGTVRLLVPSVWETEIPDMICNTEHVVVSRSQHGPSAGGFALEILMEDGSEQPFSLHLSAGQIDRLPAWSDDQRRCRFALYVNRDGPRCVFECDAFTQVVPGFPWLQRIDPRNFR